VQFKLTLINRNGYDINAADYRTVDESLKAEAFCSSQLPHSLQTKRRKCQFSAVSEWRRYVSYLRLTSDCVYGVVVRVSHYCLYEQEVNEILRARVLFTPCIILPVNKISQKVNGFTKCLEMGLPRGRNRLSPKLGVLYLCCDFCSDRAEITEDVKYNCSLFLVLDGLRRPWRPDTLETLECYWILRWTRPLTEINVMANFCALNLQITFLYLLF